MGAWRCRSLRPAEGPGWHWSSRARVDVAERMSPDLMGDAAFQDLCDEVRRIPERVLMVVGAGIMHVPVARPRCVAGRARHLRMRESVRGPAAPLEKQMTDGGPRDREGATLEDLQQQWEVSAFSTSLRSRHLRGRLPKRPTQLEIRGRSCRGPSVVLEGRDRDTIEDAGSRLRA